MTSGSRIIAAIAAPSSAWVGRTTTRVGGGAAWAVVVDDAHVAANGGLYVLPAPSAHVAMFGMSVGGAWQGCGLGHLLLRHLIDDARGRGLRRLALEVFTENPRAQALYAAHGFVHDGIRPAEATCDGGYADSRAMSLALRTPTACTARSA